MVLRRGLGVLLAIAMLAAPAFARAAEQRPWVLVDTDALTLTVFSSGNRVLARFRNISIGSGGVADVHRRGDETTPRGVFHIAWIDRASRYGTFYGIDYPTAGIARRAYVDGIIGEKDLDAIAEAFRHHRIPPQTTPLGGRLGIHGIGRGDPAIHRTLNWTNGCVALSNRQIRQLDPWMRLGTRVVIR